ncbi:hypothetical protein EV182_004924 [Spiromyces aspiralis]|uniref:Uncharacterized protein n=1 Tax=Spiromyces aspiralis TaxID=68401 RepID=A0ACC1HP92_9FUNG|nr:hypothetical protein EV182_004924 [Spiromyces aspiralis]
MSSESPDSLGVLEDQQAAIELMQRQLHQLKELCEELFDAIESIGQPDQQSLLKFDPIDISARVSAIEQLIKAVGDEARKHGLNAVPIPPPLSPTLASLGDSFTHVQAIVASAPGKPVLDPISDYGALRKWLQAGTDESKRLFADQQRVAQNARAALSVPPPQFLPG